VKAVFGSLPVPVFLLSAAVAAWALALIRLINYLVSGSFLIFIWYAWVTWITEQP
jgi:hypothetical protein